MKQVLQNLRNGNTVVQDVPAPRVGHGQVLISTRATLISAGTERMLVEFGKAGLIGKAKAQPEKVQQVIDKIKSDGLIPTLDSVFTRLDEPIPLGYCNAGVVLEVGPGVEDVEPGDRVACNGAHAEVVVVPKHLCAKVPDGVGYEQAAFTVLSAIGLQGVRLASPELGEKFVVYGLGIIGLLCVQILRANGCDVLGIDVNQTRAALAERMGVRTAIAGKMSDAMGIANAWSAGQGVDGVLITASSDSEEIIHNSALMCRKRGRIVLIGVVGLKLRRADFYEKELTFQVSCSYGPGRYDEAYEVEGKDYPIGFVRWTEQRNFVAVLGLMANGRLKVDELITDRFPLVRASEAYDKVTEDSNALGVILQYPDAADLKTKICFRPRNIRQGVATVGVIGAGNFSKMTLMAALAKSGARIKYVCDIQGAAAVHLASKYGAEAAATDYRDLLGDDDVRAVVIAVGHQLHARLVRETLDAGKHVFVEKPLCLNTSEIAEIVSVARQHTDLQVVVGFNRRFSPHVVRIKELLQGRAEPLAMSMTVNAGALPASHWVQDRKRGGGRIVGEACHFIDLMVHIAGAPVQSVAAVEMGQGPVVREDKMSIILSFDDGSVGSVNYYANGTKAYPKETLEVFTDGRVLRLNNFRRTEGYGFKGFKKYATLTQDKGHAAEFAAFAKSLETGGAPIIPFEHIINVTLATFAAVASAKEGRTIVIGEEYGEQVLSHERAIANRMESAGEARTCPVEMPS